MKLACSVLVVTCAIAAHPVFAQSYPSKPIELVVHTALGGGSDLVARTAFRAKCDWCRRRQSNS